jgi:hypothetical protein
VLNHHEPTTAGMSIPFELAMGVPVVTGRSSNGPVRAIVDSGAPISYVPTALVEGLTPIGRRKDFYPGFGEFETDVWRVRTVLGRRRLTLQAGVLPPTLQMMFGMILGPEGWIVGSDFFRGRKIEIDYGRQRFVDISAVEDAVE